MSWLHYKYFILDQLEIQFLPQIWWSGDMEMEGVHYTTDQQIYSKL
jgi:hypothetical protein